eukprot:TRINITY_DN391_c0_g1_i1.p1 TRINITY_DN391_c0_g1~~TRINITY_DN391_c0_g1_i1.p1  ORF type:complete len:762 (-),score=234.44 TRINITY_DN391_c0_g1_i1:427-2712(-)
MKKIVIKMRSMKKLFGDDLLQLALLLSLMKVDPENYLGFSPHSPLDPGGDMTAGQTWAQTQAMFHDSWMHDTRSPRIHPKSMDSLLERHQAEILEDLNSLGRYSRLSQYGGIPVHISAYIVDTDHGSCQDQNDGADSDSGISDTNHDSDQETTDQEDVEKEKNPDDDDMDMECETILEDFVNPVDVLGLQSIVGLTPPPEDQNQDVLGLGTGQDALEAELVHIDEQLMNIEDDLGHIDEAFFMMDQQLAETISDDVMYDNDMFNNNLVDVNAPDVNLDNLGIEGNNPFDDWERETFANIDDLVLENVSNVELQNIPTNNNFNMEEVISQSNSNDKDDEILQDPDLFPTDETTSGSAILEEFDDDLFGGAQSKFSVRSEIDRLIKNDVVLPQMPLKTNASQPYKPIAPLPEEIFEPEEAPVFNITETSLSRESSVDRDLLEEIDVADVNVDQNDEDIIMQVLRESNIDFDEIPVDGEEIVKTELKEEDIKEEVIDVEDVSFELSLVDGASAKVEIDYEKLHSDIKSNFQESEDGSAIAEFTLSPHLSMTYNPGFNARAFEHDHNYGIAAKIEPTLLGESSRRRNVSESSGYSSMNEEAVSSRCRDEKMARKINLPFSVYDIINSPVDTFSEMLGRPGLTPDQSQICRDIRRRGKNKVAAQNCRKRKMDTIEELQSQVDQVRRRKEQLLRAREQLETERARWSSKLSFLEQTVLAGIGKDLGMFTLEVTDSAVVVTSRLTNSHQLLAAVGGAEKYPRGGRSRD